MIGADAGIAPVPFTLEGIDRVLLLVRGDARIARILRRRTRNPAELDLPRYAMSELRAGSSHVDLVDVSATEGTWARPEVPGGCNVDHLALNLGACNQIELRRHLAARGVAIVSVEDAR